MAFQIIFHLFKCAPAAAPARGTGALLLLLLQDVARPEVLPAELSRPLALQHLLGGRCHNLCWDLEEQNKVDLGCEASACSGAAVCRRGLGAQSKGKMRSTYMLAVIAEVM